MSLEAGAIPGLIVLTRWILASRSSRGVNLRGCAQPLRISIVEFEQVELQTPNLQFGGDKGCSRSEKEGHRSNRLPKEGERSFASWASTHVARMFPRVSRGLVKARW